MPVSSDLLCKSTTKEPGRVPGISAGSLKRRAMPVPIMRLQVELHHCSGPAGSQKARSRIRQLEQLPAKKAVCRILTAQQPTAPTPADLRAESRRSFLRDPYP